MIRGSNRGSYAVVGGGEVAKTRNRFRRGKKTGNKEKQGKKSRKVKKEIKESKESKQSKKQKTVDLRPAEKLTTKDFRRSDAGRESIKAMMDHIHEMDVERFENTPMFDEHCRCRLKVEGAGNISWQNILGSAPACLECMYLAWI